MAGAAAVQPEPEEVVLGNDMPDEPEPLEGRGIEVDAANDNEGQAPEEDGAEEERAKPPRGFVPIEALHEERTRRREALERYQRLERDNAEKWGRAQARMDELAKRLETLNQPKPEPEEPEPDVKADPEKWVRWNFQREARERQALEQRLAEQARYIQEREQLFADEMTRTRQTLEEQARQKQIEAMVDADEATIRSALPDYEEAIDYIAEARDRQLQVFGMTDPVMRRQQIAREVRGTVQGLLAQGASPAEKFYEYAKTLGYQGKNGRQSPFDTIRKGQAVARSSASAGGSAPKQRITLDQLANMSEEEFARLVPDRAAFRRMQEI